MATPAGSNRVCSEMSGKETLKIIDRFVLKHKLG